MNCNKLEEFSSRDINYVQLSFFFQLFLKSACIIMPTQFSYNSFHFFFFFMGWGVLSTPLFGMHQFFKKVSSTWLSGIKSDCTIIIYVGWSIRDMGWGVHLHGPNDPSFSFFLFKNRNWPCNVTKSWVV